MMPDRRGKPLRAGDKVMYLGQFGYVFGELKYDEDAKAKYHIYVTEKCPALNEFDEHDYVDTVYLKYYQKWPNGIINMDAWAEDILDTGKIDLPGPI